MGTVWTGLAELFGQLANCNVEVCNCFNCGNINGNYGAITGTYFYSSFPATIEKCYYLDGSASFGIGKLNANDENIFLYTSEYMKSNEFVEILNEYVELYNETNKSKDNFIELKYWKVDKTNSYPTFE